MKRVNVLLKPVSDRCNLSCDYCFYKGTSARLDNNNCLHMSEFTMQTVVNSAFEAAEEGVGFIFQGGEPMLWGIDAFRGFADYVKAANKGGIKVDLSIQTNGTLIDEEWARFFKTEGFFVGVSLDGSKRQNDRHRGASTDKVKACLELLRSHGISYNILSVITEQTLDGPDEFYDALKEHRFIQPIPVLKKEGSLDPIKYGEFLTKIFDRYYEDITRGDFISILPFDGILVRLFGKSCGSCAVDGRCGGYFVVEADGGVYPCDFYVDKDHILGNVKQITFTEIAKTKKATDFIKESYIIPKKCKACKWASLCRGGCKKARINNEYLYCESMRLFLEKTEKKFLHLQKILMRR